MTSSLSDRAERGFERIDDERCRAFQEHVELIGRRWTPGILLAGMRGAERFSEYRALVTGISDRLLALRLKELELEGLVEREVVPTTPVMVRYRPSARARELMRVMQPLIHWAVADRDRRDAELAAEIESATAGAPERVAASV